MIRTTSPVLTVVGACLGVMVMAGTLVGCTDNRPTGGAGDARELTVQADDTTCAVSAATAPSGNLTFHVTNGGSVVTEFYLLADDGLRIIGEVENIGPGLTRDLVVVAPTGSYFTACKPGMIGEGIRAPFTVEDSGEPVGGSADDRQLIDQAVTAYQAYVRDQTEQLVAKTQSFVELYTAGRDDEARALYADARTHWERIEPVAESFGDLDPRMDLREADLEAGQTWTGWHRIEKDLWPARAENYTPMSAAERKAMAEDLMTNTQELYTRTRTITFTAVDIANGSRGLLDEVATGKVTGEEEYWSRTDLWDFQANVDGARVAYEDLKPLLAKRDPDLDARLGQRFDQLQALLDQHRDGEGFVGYDDLTPEQIKALSDAVNALSEPLSQLAAAVA